MRELNQLLLDFDIKTNFSDHDYYVSEVTILHSILLINGQNGKKKFSI